MAIPNSHAGLFTQVPERVVKSWDTVSRMVETSDPVPDTYPSLLHSPIRFVRIEVGFADVRNLTSDQFFDAADDFASDRITCWQQTRRFYSDIESAVEEVITRFSASLSSEAKTAHSRAVQSLSRRRTIAYPWSTSTPTLSHDNLQSVKRGTASTVLPSDSVTVLTHRPKRSNAHSHRKKRSVARSNKDSASILQYFAAT
jgi:hypothetical protein